jgi:hypothetical protein
MEQSPGSGPAERGQRETPGQGHDRNKCTLHARREVDLLIVPTSEAIGALQAEPKDTNAILHVTC